jgi:hypothetical protein
LRDASTEESVVTIVVVGIVGVAIYVVITTTNISEQELNPPIFHQHNYTDGFLIVVEVSDEFIVSIAVPTEAPNFWKSSTDELGKLHGC